MASTRSTQPIYRCPHAAAICSRSRTTSTALRDRSAAAWMKLFDERYKRTTWPYGSACGARRSGSAPQLRDENIVSMDEGGTNLFWAERFGQSLGPRRPVGQAVRQQAHRVVQGPRHDRAGLGGQADDRRRQLDRGRRVRLHRATLGLAGRLRGGRRHSRRSCSCRGARSPPRSSCSRSPTAPWCSRSTPTSTAAWPSSSAWPREERVYLANSMNSLRLEGQKTVAIEIVQQFDWQVPDVVDHPGRQPRQRQRARRGLRPDGELGRHAASGRASSWRRPKRPTRSTWPTERNWEFEPVTAQPDAGVGDPDRQPGVGAARPSARCRSTTASSSRRASRSWPRPRRAPTARACSTARTRAWRWRR